MLAGLLRVGDAFLAGGASGEDVKKYIHMVRAKIEEDPRRPQLILTVRGFGYRLAAPR